MDFNDLLSSFGMKPEDLNKNQKEVLKKAAQKVDKGDKTEEAQRWMREKYRGLFPK